MMRLSVQPIRHWRLIATGTAASAALLVFLGLEFGPHVFFLGKAVQQPIPAADSAGSGSANSLMLSVFDEPRISPEIRFQDDQGHDLTWHHSDKELFGMVNLGIPEIVPGYQTDMPKYEGVLSASDIWAVLSFIESSWPPVIRERQQRLDRHNS
jgi:hypothetical protein